MANKEVKPTIGLLKCPMKSHNAEVRKQINGILYYQCKCGKITPSREEGQRWIFDNAKMFSAEEVEVFNGFPRVGGLSVYLDKEEEKPVYDLKQEKKAEPEKKESTYSVLNPAPLDEEKAEEPAQQEQKQEVESGGIGMQF